MKKVFFRVDGSPAIGMGHIARCVRLAEYLHGKYPCDIRFLSSTPEYFDNYKPQVDKFGSIIGFTPNQNDKLLEYIRNENPHVLITDAQLGRGIDDYIRIAEKLRYHITLVESHFNHFGFGLVVFPSMYPVLPKCSCETRAEYMIGAKYLMIDQSLSEIDPPDFRSIDKIEILVTPGGADPSNATERIIEIIKTLDTGNLHFTIVLGPAKPNKDKIRESVRDYDSITISDSVGNIRELLWKSHIVITSGGTTVYESIAASRPSWVIPQIEFEKAVGDYLLKKGAIIGVGIENLKIELIDRLPKLKESPEMFNRVIKSGKKLIDSKGIIRITEKIIAALDSMTD